MPWPAAAQPVRPQGGQLLLHPDDCGCGARVRLRERLQPIAIRRRSFVLCVACVGVPCRPLGAGALQGWRPRARGAALGCPARPTGMLLGAVPGQCQAGARQCSRPGILGPLPARAPPLRLRPWSSPRSSRPWSSRHALRSGGAACQRSGAACQAAASEFGLPPSCPDHEQRYQYFTGTLRRVVRFMVRVGLGCACGCALLGLWLRHCAHCGPISAAGPVTCPDTRRAPHAVTAALASRAPRALPSSFPWATRS